jgi:membrane-associated phospholipid phosphatase
MFFSAGRSCYPALALIRSGLTAMGLAALAGCASETGTAPIPVYAPMTTVVWSAEARRVVTVTPLTSPVATRAYTLQSLAQRIVLTRIGADTLRTSPRAAVSYASARVLTSMAPTQAAAIDVVLQGELRQPTAGTLTALAAGKALGESIADSLLRARAGDSTALSGAFTLPTGPGVWVGAAGRQPVNPRWGEARPWLLTSAAAITVPPPPALNSPAFLTALAEVRRISDTRTSSQLAIATYWFYGLGTPTPPGYWNNVASDLCVYYQVTELQCATILTTMNQAMMDAGIVTWAAKYRHVLARPYQMDPAITMPIALSNHPAYPSAHASYSSSAASVLSWFFPREQSLLEGWVKEANVSRIYAGVHYRFDVDASDAIGRQVGALYVATLPAAGLRPFRTIVSP